MVHVYNIEIAYLGHPKVYHNSFYMDQNECPVNPRALYSRVG